MYACWAEHVLRKYLCCCVTLCTYALCSVAVRLCIYYTESIKVNIKNIKGRAVYPVCDGGAAAAAAVAWTLTIDDFIFFLYSGIEPIMHFVNAGKTYLIGLKENLLMIFFLLRQSMKWKSQLLICSPWAVCSILIFATAMIDVLFPVELCPQFTLANE